VPGRQEPGTGEIHPAVAASLYRLDYRGVVALEGWASGPPDQALDCFRRAFTT
jgi:hydroxypyruvate isomerase